MKKLMPIGNGKCPLFVDGGFIGHILFSTAQNSMGIPKPYSLCTSGLARRFSVQFMKFNSIILIGSKFRPIPLAGRGTARTLEQVYTFLNGARWSIIYLKHIKFLP